MFHEVFKTWIPWGDSYVAPESPISFHSLIRKRTTFLFFLFSAGAKKAFWGKLTVHWIISSVKHCSSHWICIINQEFKQMGLWVQKKLKKLINDNLETTGSLSAHYGVFSHGSVILELDQSDFSPIQAHRYTKNFDSLKFDGFVHLFHSA